MLIWGFLQEKMVNSSSVSSMNYVQPDNVTYNAPTMLDVHHSNRVSCEGCWVLVFVQPMALSVDIYNFEIECISSFVFLLNNEILEIDIICQIQWSSSY